MANKQKQRKELVCIAEYMVSCGAYFWSGYGLYLIFDYFYALDKNHPRNLFIANLICNIVGWVVNYVLQRYWVFTNKSLKKHQTEVTSRYLIITVADWFIDFIILRGLQMIGIDPKIGKFISSGFFTVWNYLWYKYWVFPEKFKNSKKVKVGPVRVIAHRPHGHSAYRKAI